MVYNSDFHVRMRDSGDSPPYWNDRNLTMWPFERRSAPATSRVLAFRFPLGNTGGLVADPFQRGIQHDKLNGNKNKFLVSVVTRSRLITVLLLRIRACFWVLCARV